MSRHIDDGLIRGPVLAPVEYGYRTVTDLRNRLYDARILRSVRLPVRVISVGNIVAGGAGKTPLVICIAQALVAAGKRVAVLSRGYKSRAEYGVSLILPGDGATANYLYHGDEAVLIARRVPELAVLSGADRVVLAQRAIDTFDVDTIVLDDGFQHRRLARDLDIVLLRAPRPFGNGHVLPQGPLRESTTGLQRAHVLVLNESDAAFADKLPEELVAGKSVFRMRMNVVSLVRVDDDSAVDRPTQQGLRVLAAIGIARPQSFRQTLTHLGLNVVDLIAKTDHHPWTDADLAAIDRRARQLDVFVVTSEKDIVKWRHPPRRSLVLHVDVELDAPEQFLRVLLNR